MDIIDGTCITPPSNRLASRAGIEDEETQGRHGPSSETTVDHHPSEAAGESLVRGELREGRQRNGTTRRYPFGEVDKLPMRKIGSGALQRRIDTVCKYDAHKGDIYGKGDHSDAHIDT